MSSSSDDYSTAGEEVEEQLEIPEEQIDPEVAARRLEEIRTSVAARNARFESLLSLIPVEHFQHLSDAEETSPPVQKTKKERKRGLAKAEKDVKQAQKALKAQREQKRDKGKGKAVVEPDISEAAPAAPPADKPSTAVLRQRLDSKIKALQAARAPTREGLLADRRAKRERQAERKKEERRQERKALKRADKPSTDLNGPMDPPPPPSAEDALALQQVKPAGTTVAFQHLDFAPSTAVRAVDTERKKSRKDAKPSSSSHDPKQALAALQDRQRFLSTHSAPAKERAEERDRWSAMAARAEGGKVYDDETKLRKAIKKQEKLKKRSKEKWTERHETVEEAKAARQQLRTLNLAKRKEEAKRPKGKSKARPGFEGGPAPRKKSGSFKSKGSAPKSARKGNAFGAPS